MDELVKARLELFPLSTRIEMSAGQTRLTIAGLDLEELAAQYGTPLYLYDQATMDAAVGSYRRSLARHYPGEAGVTYAGKAFLCLALAQWVRQQDLWLDCSSAGEVAVAAAAGLSPARTLLHGVNKSPADVAAALARAGTVVVDNLDELAGWIELARQQQVPNLWLRIRPGLAVETHRHRQTGQVESKFGLSTAEARTAVQRCLQQGLPLSGLHGKKPGNPVACGGGEWPRELARD